jgi:ribonuclease P protein component
VSGFEPAEAGLGLPRSARIRSRQDFLRIQQGGTRVQTRHFVIMMLPDSRQRIGITVTRRTAGAVGRNRVKRLVREVFRRNRSLFPPRSQVVVLARAGADRLGYAAVSGEVQKASAAMLRALKGTS